MVAELRLWLYYLFTTYFLVCSVSTPIRYAKLGGPIFFRSGEIEGIALRPGSLKALTGEQWEWSISYPNDYGPGEHRKLPQQGLKQSPSCKNDFNAF